MTGVLALALLVGLGLLGVALNHIAARISLVEVIFNEGLPPGHEVVGRSAVAGRVAEPSEIEALLGPGVHVFLSRSCHACMRLIDELNTAPLPAGTAETALHLRYIDRPRPIAQSAAEQSGASLHAHQGDLSAQVGADPLPYAIVVGSSQSQARGVSPSRKQVVALARDAGLQFDTQPPRARAAT